MSTIPFFAPATVDDAYALRLRISDVLLPCAVTLWAVSLPVADLDRINDWGLLAALPVTFYLGLAVLLASIACALVDEEPSPIRLGLHAVALVVVLHGTVPLLFPSANYPWVYKHVGVVGYINLHGALDPSVDIYQNWPGFFALAAWFTRIAGLGSPLEFARWAPLFFNLLYVLELAFVVWALPLSRRVRWLSLFVFVAANWVGQDYFAPQALAFVLCLGLFGIVLTWLRGRDDALLSRVAEGVVARVVRADRDADEPLEEDRTEVAGWAYTLVIGLAVTVFAVIVFTHQLSPFLVFFGLAAAAGAGLLRPRWIVVVLGALAFGYLGIHLGYLRSEGHLQGNPFNLRDIFGSLSNPFDNAHATGFASTNPMPGRKITALGSPVLILGLWILAVVGVVRRSRAGRPVLLLGLLAGSPMVLALGQNYGGEAIFRIFLFSLPWTAVLVASALAPAGEDGWRLWHALPVGVVLVTVAALFLSAFYGSVELYRVRPGAVEAQEYYFSHAPAGSVLGLVSTNVPGRVGATYDRYTGGSTPPPLSSRKEFTGHRLGADDLPALAALYQEHSAKTSGDMFLYLSRDQEVYVEVLRLMPAGSLDSLDEALGASPQWEVFTRNADAVIYRFLAR